MTVATYRVAYPHSKLHPLYRCCAFEMGPNIARAGILAKLEGQYPDYADDLKRGTLLRASNMSVNNRCSLPIQSQGSGLSKADVYEKSTKKVYDWINRQGDEARVPSGDMICEVFPDGPHAQTLGMVDIVVVTPESTPSRQNPYDF